MPVSSHAFQVTVPTSSSEKVVDYEWVKKMKVLLQVLENEQREKIEKADSKAQARRMEELVLAIASAREILSKIKMDM